MTVQWPAGWGTSSHSSRPGSFPPASHNELRVQKEDAPLVGQWIWAGTPSAGRGTLRMSPRQEQVLVGRTAMTPAWTEVGPCQGHSACQWRRGRRAPPFHQKAVTHERTHWKKMLSEALTVSRGLDGDMPLKKHPTGSQELQAPSGTASWARYVWSRVVTPFQPSCMGTADCWPQRERVDVFEEQEELHIWAKLMGHSL